MLKLRYFLVIFFIIISSQILTIDFEFENIWSKYTLYKNGCEVYENRLYVNAYASVEMYSIQDNGDLEYQELVESNGLIKNLQFDTNDNMLYVHASSCISDDADWINAYQIIDVNPEFCFSTGELPDSWLYKDFIYPTNNYVILIQPDMSPCYNKLTGELENITYPYLDIIGSCNNILIDYDASNSVINFYQIDNINQPSLIFQYGYYIDEPYRTLTRCFDAEHCLIVDNSQVLVFDVDDEQNISYLYTWTFPLVISNEILKEPIDLGNNQLYFGSAFGDNFIYDVSDYNSPILINSWFEEDYEAYSYSVYNGSWLYRTMDYDGIWKYNLGNMPSTQHEEFGYTFPLYSTAYFDGFIYKNDYEKVYKTDIETLEQVLICYVNLGVGLEYYKSGSLLIIRNGGIFDQDLTIIDLNSNQIVNQIPITNPFLIFLNGKFFFQNGNMIRVYELDDDYNLDFMMDFQAGNNALVSIYDEERIWVSCSEKDLIFNSQTLQIDHDFEDFFSPNSSALAVPCKYDDRLIISFTNFNVHLYDIDELENPILLDSKTQDNFYSYFILDNFILENTPMTPTRIYQKFDVSFTAPIQEYDFDTIAFELQFDETRNRIFTSSPYYFESFTYELTGSDLNLIPTSGINLSNHPNPFNPSTEIRFNVTQSSNVGFVKQNGIDLNFATIEIYNLKGQKVKTLQVSESQSLQVSVIWDGTDQNNQPVASGVYFYQLQVDGKAMAQKKCLLLK